MYTIELDDGPGAARQPPRQKKFRLHAFELAWIHCIARIGRSATITNRNGKRIAQCWRDSEGYQYLEY